ncbi:ATP-binding cassette subfamily B protein [Saccharothrix tamanrassetensis]|uniref:ATP-binding cassette subfamily B protein n=1 Tax=Saccharothrix tamanrassetensis TaxID=1051531 RepID=A0A841CDZ0_9PSEU|nr:ABC transporter ATP-binding protein [Saccharothrix tamanrassetensis]MBB5954377.1 ATP-binding cassette subfamily B protein [Saccharothrix tamanrassetensis]
MPERSYTALLRFLRPFRARIAVLVGIIALSSAIAVAPALVGQRLIDHGVLRGDSRAVWLLGGVLAAVGLGQSGLSYVERRYAATVAEDVVLRLRTDLFAHLQRQAPGFFTAARTGAVVSRVHGDVTGVQSVVSSTIPAAVGAVVMLVAAGGAVAVMEWRLVVLVLVLLPLLYLLTSKFTAALRRAGQDVLTSQADLDTLVAERLSPDGTEVIRHYSRPDCELPGFRVRADRVRTVSVRRAGVAAALGAVLTSVIGLTTAVVYVVSGQLVISGALSVGTMVALVALLARLYGPLTALPGVRAQLVAGLVAFDRAREVLDFAPRIAEQPGARRLPRTGTPPSVAFRDVGFGYPSPDALVVPSLAGDIDDGAGRDAVLTAVDFTAEPGSTVGIVGFSGAGKSTLTRLLTRSWDVTDGQVLVDGVDIRRLRLDDVRAAVGVVTQETFLFNDTIRANLLLARPEASTDELVAACQDAWIWPLIEQLPAGLDTVLGDRGLRLSGGERQRLAIARLLLKRPQIVVLDEATSHCDTVTEQRIQESLKPFLRERTCLVIAHRLSTVRAADLILVMRDGRVVERGRHDELVAAGGWYARLHQAQHAGGTGMSTITVDEASTTTETAGPTPTMRSHGVCRDGGVGWGWRG